MDGEQVLFGIGNGCGFSFTLLAKDGVEFSSRLLPRFVRNELRGATKRSRVCH